MAVSTAEDELGESVRAGTGGVAFISQTERRNSPDQMLEGKGVVSRPEDTLGALCVPSIAHPELWSRKHHGLFAGS